MKFQAAETKTITKKLTKACRPSYNCRDLESTLEAAARMSLAYQCKYQVIATYYGFQIINYATTPTPGEWYFETDGKIVTRYERVSAESKQHA